MLVALLMVMGVTSVWAENWSIDFAAIGANYADKTNMTITESTTIGGTSMGTCKVGEEDIDAKFVLQTGTTWMLRKSSGLYQGNGGGRAMGLIGCTEGQIITIVGTGDPNPSTNVTFKSKDGNTYVYTVNANGDVKFTPARYLYFTTISVEDPSATAIDYTIKYVDGEGNEIKTASVFSAEAGTTIALGSSDKEDIVYNDEKYIYVSDDSEGKTVASDGSTVVTVTFRKAAVWSWTLNAKYGTNNVNIGSGSVFEGNSAYAIYPLYYNVDGTLYTKASEDTKTYNHKITPTSDGFADAIEYSATAIKDVVFFAEAEDIATLEPVTSAYLSERFSAGKGAYAKEVAQVITTLPAGKYKLTAQIMGTMSECTFTFKAGDETIWENATNSDSFYIGVGVTGQEFTLTENTDIILESAGGDGSSSRVSNLVDFIYIVQTDAPVALPSLAAGYATFSSSKALDFTAAATKAYIATAASGSTVTMKRVNKVPANTGLVLQGAGSEDIPVLSGDADDMTGNLLIASTGANVAAGNYVFAKQGEAFGFYKLTGEVAVPAGKAYLSSEAGLSGSEVRFVFDDATAISSVKATETQQGVYNLAGQRIEKAVKGINIVNGKKLIVK